MQRQASCSVWSAWPRAMRSAIDATSKLEARAA